MSSTYQLENWLRSHGNGIGVSSWNDHFDITCMTGHLRGGARTILGSGRDIETAMRNADIRIKELAVLGLTPQQHAAKLAA